MNYFTMNTYEMKNYLLVYIVKYILVKVIVLSKNKYTIESIDTVKKVLNRKCNMIFDRGYDDNKIIDYVDSNGDYFVIRMDDKRNFLFKGIKKNCYKEAVKRKGKVRMEL